VQNVGVSEEAESRVPHHKVVDSILFNTGGKLFMVQQELSLREQLGTLKLVKVWCW